MPVQLQSIENRTASVQHFIILLRIRVRQFGRKEVFCVFSDNVVATHETTPFHQRFIDDRVTSGGVFDEESDVRRMIEQLLQGADMDRVVAQGVEKLAATSV